MLPPGYRTRPPTRDDIEAVTDIVLAVDQEQFGEPDWSVEDQTAEWADPGLDLATDALLALDGQATPVGYGVVTVVEEGRDYTTDTYVHPAHDADGRIEDVLLDFAEARAAQRAEPGARLVTVKHEPDVRRRERLERRGYTELRRFWRMEYDVPADLPVPTVPDGVAIRPHRFGVDDEAMHAVIEDAFAGSFRFAPYGFEEFKARHLGRSNLDEAPWLLAWEGEQVLGGLMSIRDSDARGWIRNLGIHPAARGRGIGLALLQTAFRDLAGRGVRLVALGVDAENATGALGIYERAGMHVRREFVFYQRRLDAITP